MLRELAAVQGVDMTDDDIENVLGFLQVLYPALLDVEAKLPEGYEL